MDPNQNQGGGAPTDAPATDQPVVDPNAPVQSEETPAAPEATPEATPETPAPDTSGGDQGGMGGGTGTV